MICHLIQTESCKAKKQHLFHWLASWWFLIIHLELWCVRDYIWQPKTCFGNLILWVNFIKDITGTSFENFWHVISLHKDCNFSRVLNLNLESEELQCTLSCAPVGICFVNYLLQFSCTIKKFNSMGTRGKITVLVY